MGMDFVAILELGNDGVSASAVGSLEQESPPSVQVFARLLLARGWRLWNTKHAVWVDQRCSAEVRLDHRPELPDLERALRLPEGFFLTFGKDAALVHHTLRWQFFLRDPEIQAAALDATAELCRHFSAKGCLLTCQTSPLHTSFFEGGSFATCLAAGCGDHGEVQDLAELYVEVESGEPDLALRPGDGRIRRIVRRSGDEPLPPDWTRPAVWDSKGYWRFEVEQETSPRLADELRAALRDAVQEEHEPSQPRETPGLLLDSLFPVSKRGRYGFMDPTGDVVIDLRFQDAGAFVAGRAPVKVGRRWRYVDTRGDLGGDAGGGHEKWVVPASQADESNLCPVSREGRGCPRRFGFVHASTRFVAIPFQFLGAREFSEGRAAVQTPQGWGFVDEAGEWVVEPGFADVDAFSHGYAAVFDGSAWGYVNREGETTVACTFEEALPFRPERVSRVRLNRRWGYIRADGSYLWEPAD